MVCYSSSADHFVLDIWSHYSTCLSSPSLLIIWEVHASTLDLEAGYLHWGSWLISSVPSLKCRLVPWNKSWPLHSTSFQVYHSQLFSHSRLYHLHSSRNVVTWRQNVAAEWLSLLVSNREVPGSKSRSETNNLDKGFSSFPQSLKANTGAVP
jgi:hypothetical protein